MSTPEKVPNPPCTPECKHIGTDNNHWVHSVRVAEDKGEIHTDDCGFFQSSHLEEPGDGCTAGKPGVVCRVYSAKKAKTEPMRLTNCKHYVVIEEGKCLECLKEAKDEAYLERNQVVSALSKLFPAGVAKTAIEGWSEDWHGCVYIDLPTGQVSWHFHDSQAYLFAHLPPYTNPWDGHTTDEKYKRLATLDPVDPQQNAGHSCACGMHFCTGAAK